MLWAPKMYSKYHLPEAALLTHWGRVTHICVDKLSLVQIMACLLDGAKPLSERTNAGILLIGPLGINFSEIVIEIYIFSFKKMHLKMSYGKWRPFCLSHNELTHRQTVRENTCKTINSRDECLFKGYFIDINYSYSYMNFTKGLPRRVQ